MSKTKDRHSEKSITNSKESVVPVESQATTFSDSEIAALQSDKQKFIIFRADALGNISYSNMLLPEQKPAHKNLRAFIPNKEYKKIACILCDALTDREVKSSIIYWEKTPDDLLYRSTLFIPAYEKEVLIIACESGSEFLSEESMPKNGNCFANFISFLPGKALVADENHQLIKLNGNSDENQEISTVGQVGESLGCINFHTSEGKCGFMNVCNNCDINQAIHDLHASNKGTYRKKVTIPVFVNGSHRYKKFLLTTSCIYLENNQKYLLYLEDSFDQKIGLKELKESNKLLLNVLDSLPFSVYWKNLHSTYLGGNKHFKSKLKLKPEENIFGKKDIDFFDIETADENKKTDEIAINIDKHLYRVDSSNATSRSRNSIKTVLHGDNQEKIGIVGANIDYAGQNWYNLKGDKKALSDQESILDKFGIAAWNWHLNENEMTGNTTWQNLMGIDTSSIQIEKWLENIDESDQWKIEEVQHKLIPKGEFPFEYQIRYIPPEEKEIRWMELTCNLISYDSLGNPEKISGKMIDITAQKRQEDIKSEKLSFASALINSTKDAIWSIDTAFQLTTMNNSFMANYFMMFGKDPEFGHSCLDDMDAIMRKKWKRRYTKAMNGSSFKATDEHDYEGHQRRTETLFSPIILDSEITGVSCFSRELSS